MGAADPTAPDPHIESGLDGDASRMASCLHLELVKRSPASDPNRSLGDVETLTRDEMVAATSQGLGTRHPRRWDATMVMAQLGHARTARRTSSA